MTALVAVAVAGWQLFDGVGQWLAAAGLPALMATVWGTFGLAEDPSRGGSPAIEVPGVVRLMLELTFFGAGFWALWSISAGGVAVVFGILVIAHYAVSWDRLAWLLGSGQRT